MNVVVIPARGGSKVIPQKNVIDFCGKPLLAWSILQARSASSVTEVFVSTDDDQIEQVSLEFGAKVIRRPQELASDTASSESALLHALEELKDLQIENLIMLQATSPLREPEDIDGAVGKIDENGVDSVFSGAFVGDFFLWKKMGGELTSINYDYQNRQRKQDFEESFGEQYVENGSIYVMKPSLLQETGNRLSGKIGMSQMELWKSFEIDDQEGLELCKSLFSFKLKDKSEKI